MGEKVIVGKSWPDHFVELVNLIEDKVPVVVAIGIEQGINAAGELKEEIRETVNDIKTRKVAN